MAKALIASLSTPDYWRAYLSEAENNYGGVIYRQATSLLPHSWLDIPIRVVIASAASMNDEDAAKAFGLSPTDHEAIAAARAGRLQFEDRQARICEFARECRVDRVPTSNHYVQNAAPDRVADIITGLIKKVR